MKRQAASEQGGGAVWKMIYLARRNPALRPEEFAQAWREHSALGRLCRNVGQRVQAVAQCARVLSGPAQAAALSQDHDGVNLMVLAEREAGSAIWCDPETLAIMRPDEPRVFADYVRNFSLLCRQQVLRGSLCVDVLPQHKQVMLIGFFCSAATSGGALRPCLRFVHCSGKALLWGWPAALSATPSMSHHLPATATAMWLSGGLTRWSRRRRQRCHSMYRPVRRTASLAGANMSSC